MAVHTIMLPDRMRGDELRLIVWDDEAGAVTGTHDTVSELQRVFDAPKPVTIGDEGGAWDLRDPAHDPAEFLTALGNAFWPALRAPLRSTLPTVFDGVEVPKPDPGETLYENGRELIQVPSTEPFQLP